MMCRCRARQVTPADVQSLERELLKRMDIIVAKKRKLALLRRGGPQQSGAGAGRLWGVLAGAASSVWSGGQSQSQLKQEIAAMEVRAERVLDMYRRHCDRRTAVLWEAPTGQCDRRTAVLWEAPTGQCDRRTAVLWEAPTGHCDRRTAVRQ